jgi:Zn-dependent protease
VTFVCILVAWLFTLCLHEFAHALVALRGGDVTVRAKGYLTLNPLRYTHPVYSLLLPILFIAIGGIALPGGAVYIERDRLKGPQWETAVSLAGPATNGLIAVLLSLAFRFGLPARIDVPAFWNGLAFFVYLQVMAALLNLLPVPPLDGYGAIEPWLPWRVRARLQFFKQYGMLILFILLFWVIPGVFFTIVAFITSLILAVPPDSIARGYANFRIF